MLKRITINTVLASIILQSTPLFAYGSFSVSASTRIGPRQQPAQQHRRPTRAQNFLSGIATFCVVGAFVYIIAQGGDLRVELSEHHTCPGCGIFSLGSVQCTGCAVLRCPECHVPNRNGRVCNACTRAHQCPSCHLYSRNGVLCQTCINRCPECRAYSHGGRICNLCDVANQCPSCHAHSRNGALCRNCAVCPRCHNHSRNGTVCAGCQNAYRHLNNRCNLCHRNNCQGGHLCVSYTFNL